MIRWTSISRVLAVAALAVTADSAAAQGGPEGRMRDFLRVSRDYAGTDALAAFFPARGTFDWVLTTREAGGTTTGRWRFAAAELVRATDPSTGPLCDSFSPGADARVLGTLMTQVLDTEGSWRRVGGTRFVPRGASATSPVFVEWRREDDGWVIGAFGDTRDRRPPLLNPWSALPALVRDTVPAGLLALPLPADAALAPGARWFVQNEPILVGAWPLVKYGEPRRMEAGSLRRIGAVDGVGAYVERGDRGPHSVVYLPVSSDGLFHPYQLSIGTGCGA